MTFHVKHSSLAGPAGLLMFHVKHWQTAWAEMGILGVGAEGVNVDNRRFLGGD
jgi:hypothetical protein